MSERRVNLLMCALRAETWRRLERWNKFCDKNGQRVRPRLIESEEESQGTKEMWCFIHSLRGTWGGGKVPFSEHAFMSHSLSLTESVPLTYPHHICHFSPPISLIPLTTLPHLSITPSLFVLTKHLAYSQLWPGGQTASLKVHRERDSGGHNSLCTSFSLTSNRCHSQQRN